MNIKNIKMSYNLFLDDFVFYSIYDYEKRINLWNIYNKKYN